MSKKRLLYGIDSYITMYISFVIVSQNKTQGLRLNERWFQNWDLKENQYFDCNSNKRSSIHLPQSKLANIAY